jgi:hypothetical protein
MTQLGGIIKNTLIINILYMNVRRGVASIDPFTGI